MAKKELKPPHVETVDKSLKRKISFDDTKLSTLDDNLDASDSSGEPLSESADEASDEKADQNIKSNNSNKAMSAAEVRAARSATETFKSNIFKLQVDEVLKEISIDEKYAAQARKLLFTLREAIAATTSLGPFDSKSAINAFTTHIPTPKEAYEVPDAKYKFAYVAPNVNDVNVLGSWSLHTTIRRPGRPSGIDLYVPMSKSIFEHKDFLDFRYHKKRAFFLAALASQLADNSKLSVEPRFAMFNGHELKPTLQLVPTGPFAKLGKKVTIFIHVGPPCDVFPLQRLAPGKNADRKVDGPTPVYNWSILSDIFMMHMLRYLHHTASVAPAFADAVRLGALWLLQRDWGSAPAKGGFGAFEFSVLMASLLNGGSKTGKKRLLPGYSSYQLFKGTLLFVAENPKISLEASFSPEGAGPTKLMHGNAGLVFADCGMDVLANVPDWAFKLLQHDSMLAVDMLNDSTRDRFHSLFLKNISSPHLRFDVNLEVSLSQAVSPVGCCNDISSVLERAWGNRFIAMKVVPKDSHLDESLNSTWSLSSDTPTFKTAEYLVSAVIDGENSMKRVTLIGPELNNDSNAFKAFWGSRASLRRFQDGSIKDAVIWQESNAISIVEEAAEYSLSKHLNAETTSQNQSLEKSLLKYTASSHDEINATDGFTSMNASFQKLGQVLLELRSALPLRIIAVFGTSSALRSASLKVPQPFNPEHVAEGIIEMESSSKWPVDAEAAEKVKSAFLIKIAQTMRNLHSQYFVVVGLEPFIDDPTVESAFVTIQTPEGFYFKLRIVSRSSKNPSRLLALADHTRLMTTVINRYPSALSTTIRLVKLWLEKQMLMIHFTEPAVELLALHTFVNSSPYAPPVSANTGFWRVLDSIAHWNWRENALFLDVDKHVEDEVENNLEHQKIVSGCDMDHDLFQTMTASFETQRKQDPALTEAPWVIYSKLDLSGVQWTKWNPRSRVAAVVAARVTALSRASKPGRPIFKASLSDFDLIWTVEGPKSSVSKHKNIAVSNPQKAIIGAHNISKDLVEALNKLYKDSLVFFYSGFLDSSSNSQHKLCAIWNRGALEPTKKIKANVQYPIRKVNDAFSLDKDALLLEIDRLGSGILIRENKQE